MIVRRLWRKVSTPFPVLNFEVRWGSSNSGFRIARKVYEPGEEVPRPGQKSRVQMEKVLSPAEQGATTNTSSLFTFTMSEIRNCITKKKIALEGTRLIEDALLIGMEIEKLFLLKSIKEVPDKIKTLLKPEVEIHRVGQKQMQLWSSVTTPPGIIGIFPKPSQAAISQWTSSCVKLPVTVICDNLREPGNLGSILRSAAGAGCKKILLSKGSVDPWDEKVLRGGSGAQFRLPIISDIPMFTIGSHLDLPTTSSFPSVGIFVADSSSNKTKFEIPTTSYQDVNYGKYGEIYLVLGGESEGIGDDTFQIISNFKSSFGNTNDRLDAPTVDLTRIHISLYNDVESLNVANAFGIIVFEIKRQLEVSGKLKTSA